MSQMLARHAAHAAYAAALSAPASTDWRGLADTLFAALPALPRATVESGLPGWWAEYDLPRVYVSESVDFLFADGETVRCEIHRAPRGLPRIPAACRAAVGFYRARTGAAAVPEFARIVTTESAQVFDSAECSRLTAAVRAVPGTVRGRAITVEALARMESELDRRRAGLSRMLKGDHAFTSGSLNAWRAAVVAGVRELDAMRDLFEAQRAGMSDPEALAGFREAKADAAAAAWCDAVADAYAVPAVFELSGTFEAVAELTLKALESPVHSGEAALATAREFLTDLSTCEVAQNGKLTELACPAESMSHFSSSSEAAKCDMAQVVEPAAVLVHPATERKTTEADESARKAPTLVQCEAASGSTLPSVPELPDNSFEPTTETHPVIALALSHKAREALFDRIQDGTFPDARRAATGGAWRLTLADALECQDVASVRFVGMPRKAYTRRTPPPAAPVTIAIAMPAEFAGSAFYPAPYAFDRAIVHHAANVS